MSSAEQFLGAASQRNELQFVIARLDKAELPGSIWGQMQELVVEGLEDAYPGRPQPIIDNLADIRRVSRFATARIDPETDVQRGRLKPNQGFAKPIISLALTGHLDDELTSVIGFASSADNTSGSWPIRKVKMHTQRYRYAWGREIYVDRHYRGQGVGHALLALSLSERDRTQPVSAYVLTENVSQKAIVKSLKGLGARITNLCGKPEETPAFGYGQVELAEQYRLEAPSAQLVLDRILNKPGVNELAQSALADAARLGLDNN